MKYPEIRLSTSDRLSESFDRVALQIVSNRTVRGVVDRHPNRPAEGDGLLRHLRQSLMDVGLLRKGGVEVDAKNLLNSDESGNEDWAWDGPVGGNDGMGSECDTPFSFGRGFSLGG